VRWQPLVFTALLACSTAHAQPAGQGDAVLGLLKEKGLLTTESQAPVIQQVRDTATELVMTAMNFLGVPYRRGGSSEDGFDCSGFTRYIFENSLGLVLPRRADEQAQWNKLMPVKMEELKPGDLVFFNTLKRAFSHVGIYIGDGKFIHSPRTGTQVRIEDMRQAYWTTRFNGARRADLSQLKEATPALQPAASTTVAPVKP
jgi:cell wall-associated NlpC family hydrolase